MIDIELPKKIIYSDSFAYNDAIDLPCDKTADTLFDETKTETVPIDSKSMVMVVEDHPLIQPNRGRRQKKIEQKPKAQTKAKFIQDGDQEEKTEFHYSFVNEKQ